LTSISNIFNQKSFKSKYKYWGGAMLDRTEQLNVWRNVCLLMIGLISVAEATVPPIPKGIVSMPATEPGGFPDSILNDSRIVGLDIGGRWQNIETTEGVYDFSSIDTELAAAEAHGKQVVLVITSGGINVPGWLLTNYPAIQTFTFIDPNPYHSTYGQPLTIPVFWDSIFLAKKTAFIQAAGAHYAAHSSIAVVSCSFANATTDDWNIPNAPADIANWLAAGYTTELMVNAGEMIVDATMSAFPNQNVVLAIGRNSDSLDPTEDYLSETVVDYATTTYGRFITAKYSLAANTPDPAIDTSLFNWQVLFDRWPNVAGQMLWKVTGDTTYRMNGGVAGDPATILLNAVTIGSHYGTQYQEIYEVDLENPTLSSVITTADTLLTSTPIGPPIVATNSATNVANFSATLNGTVNPNGLTTAVHFEYGTTTNYGFSTATQNYQGSTAQNVTASLGGLTAGATYYFRILASNAAGTTYGADSSFTTPVARAVVADFNDDSHPDLVIQNTIGHETVVAYLDNNVVVGVGVGATLPPGWRLIGAADFDGDGNTDYVLFSPATGQTVIAYLSGLTVIGAAYGPTVPPGWELVRVADFNGDAYPDYVLYCPSTGETVIVYLNNTVVVGAAYGPTLPPGWSLIDIADFNGDGHPDYALFNWSTGQTVIGYLSGVTVIGAAFGPTLPLGWPLVATADLDGDGHPDYVLYNPGTGETAIGYLNNTIVVNAALGLIVPAGWSLVGP
jgi:hypothetical protein